jgi:bis(5'-adenosyl)-triphosphatase
VLVSPLRSVARFSQLTPAEVADLFLTVQKVDRLITGLYGATSSTITIQGRYGTVPTSWRRDQKN